MREKLIEIIECYADFLDWDTKEDMVDSIMEKCFATDNNVGSKWIPVSERLPENREDVLLCRKFWNEIQRPKMGWYNDVSGEWFDLSNRVIYKVTHWMPLPEPPKEDK